MSPRRSTCTGMQDMLNGGAGGEDKLLSTVGLCARARKLIVGTPMVCDALREVPREAPRGARRKEGRKNGASALCAVLEAADTSENTHRKLTAKCAYYGVPLYRLSVTTEALARAVGKTGVVASVGITDDSLLRALVRYLPAEETLEETLEEMPAEPFYEPPEGSPNGPTEEQQAPHSDSDKDSQPSPEGT